MAYGKDSSKTRGAIGVLEFKEQETNPHYDQGFFDRCVGLFTGTESGHMGADMYQHHDGHYCGQPMSGVLTWDNHAKFGTIPQLERHIFDNHITDVVKHIGNEVPVVGFGPTAGIRKLVAEMKSPTYVPVDSCNALLAREKEQFALNKNIKVEPAVMDFFEGTPTTLINQPALGVLAGLTITNIPMPAPKEEPDTALVQTFRHFSRCMPAGGYFLVSTDINQNGDAVKELYNEKWHKLFGVNFLYRMELELPTTGFAPDHFVYEPMWDAKSSLLAHTIRATKAQIFTLGHGSNAVEISVKEGDIFHYNNSFKFRPQFFEACAEKAGYKIERIWGDKSTIRLYLFQLPRLLYT